MRHLCGILQCLAVSKTVGANNGAMRHPFRTCTAPMKYAYDHSKVFMYPCVAVCSVRVPYKFWTGHVSALYGSGCEGAAVLLPDPYISGRKGPKEYNKAHSTYHYFMTWPWTMVNDSQLSVQPWQDTVGPLPDVATRSFEILWQT